MMRKLLILFLSLISKVALASKVLAIVGGIAITSGDVDRRIEALKLANPNIVVNDLYRKYVLDELINEELFHNEADRLNFEISEQEIDQHFRDLKRKYGFSEAQVKAFSENESLRLQVESQLLWNKMVSNIYYNRIKVSKDEINDEKKIKSKEIKSVTFKQLIFSASQLNKAIQLKAQNCAEFDRASLSAGFEKPLTNSVSFNDLNPDIQAVITNLSDNMISSIFGNSEYKQIIMVCSRQVIEKDRDERDIENELSNKKMNAEAQKYLNELRKRIYVEYVK